MTRALPWGGTCVYLPVKSVYCPAYLTAQPGAASAFAALPVPLPHSSVTGTQPILTFAPCLAWHPQPRPDPSSPPS